MPRKTWNKRRGNAGATRGRYKSWKSRETRKWNRLFRRGKT